VIGQPAGLIEAAVSGVFTGGKGLIRSEE